MAKIRRRAYPSKGARIGSEYGKSGQNRVESHSGATGASGRGGLPNKPRKDKK